MLQKRTWQTSSPQKDSLPKVPLSFHRRCALCASIFLLCFAIGNQVSANPDTAPCLKLFRTRNLVKASRCFEKAAVSMGPGAQLSAELRVKKGRLLRNAATILQSAAKQEVQIEIAAHLREQAIEILKRYDQEALYESIERKKSALLLQHQLRDAIGYATLSVVADHPNAQLKITGYRFSEQVQGNWVKRLRPGPYEIQMTLPGQTNVLKRSIHLLPNRTRVVSFSAGAVLRPASIKKQRTTALILIGIGGALAVAGGVLAGVAYGALQSDINNIQQKFRDAPDTLTANDTRHIISSEGLRDILGPLGWAVLGVGLATATVGIIFLALPPPRAPGSAGGNVETNAMNSFVLHRDF